MSALSERPHWASRIKEWHGDNAPANTPHNKATVMAVPELRSVYHAMSMVAAQEEGTASMAYGMLTALDCSAKSWETYPPGPFLDSIKEQYEIGYAIGLELLWQAFRYETGGHLGDLVEGYYEWPYGESPEDHIEKWKQALEAKQSAELKAGEQ